MSHHLLSVLSNRHGDQPVCLTAICSAHPWILKAAIRFAKKHQQPCLIEATCNQVNQEGGYTGMQPIDFVSLVRAIADEEHFEPSRLILGGDHLGPNPWRHLDSSIAMANAEDLVRAYALAGFEKIHLDTSMSCADDPDRLDERTIALRAAKLAVVVEKVCIEHGLPLPAYVIGTEVPPPGGAAHILDELVPTRPEAAQETIRMHREQFDLMGVSSVFDRVIALVVQPGVEFGDSNVYAYNEAKAAGLAMVLQQNPGICFEAHSTDYQAASALRQLAIDGFCIQKVGPWLSYAYREALFALDSIAGVVSDDYVAGTLPKVMDAAMVKNPEYWQDHYTGSQHSQRLKRQFSYSDRIRYYWSTDSALKAVEQLLETLGNDPLPEIVISQYLPQYWRTAMTQAVTAETVIFSSIESVLKQYPLVPEVS